MNNVLPGATGNERLERIPEAKAERRGRSVTEVEADEKSLIPPGRFARPEEIAFGFAVAFRASPAAT